MSVDEEGLGSHSPCSSLVVLPFTALASLGFDMLEVRAYSGFQALHMLFALLVTPTQPSSPGFIVTSSRKPTDAGPAVH